MDNNTSAIDDCVNMALDQIAEELEEQQIAHERSRREELKAIENERQLKIEQIR